MRGVSYRCLMMAAAWLVGAAVPSASSPAASPAGSPASLPASSPGGSAAGLAEAGRPMRFLSFDGSALPVNRDGASYPNQYAPEGTARIGIDETDAISGRSIRFEVTAGILYAQFNAHNADGTRGFAREYIPGPRTWPFNTFNRLSFWIQCPTNATPLATGGRQNMDFGTYVKRIRTADARSDETGGGHWYHLLNIPATGTWTRVIINMHPHHRRGDGGGAEQRDQPHPTREDQYNYFDTLTRFYISAEHGRPSSYPAVYRLDEFEFYREPRPENDQQVYGIAATVVPSENRLILTWSRDKNDNAVRHEVRYAFADIHQIGWEKASAAPDGPMVKPPGWQGYNGMVYTTTQLPLAGKPKVYLAIKPENATLFSQIELPMKRIAE